MASMEVSRRLRGHGIDNYIAEVEALVEALTGEPEGSRFIIVMDATSPVTAWARFHSCHAPSKAAVSRARKARRTRPQNHVRFSLALRSGGPSLTE
eukprot:7089733-Prymnesium_polylepis.1